MKVSTVMAALMAAVLLGSAGGAKAVPIVSNVNMGQITGTRQVQITYELGGEDAIVTLSIETNGVAIPDSAVTWLTGDVCKKVAVGTGRSIQWNAGADWPENLTETAKARVTAWCVDAPPQVMVINLTGGKDAVNYPVAYYTSVGALPGGVTNVIYKSAYLVMRKIPQGHFNMGEGTCAVTLTNDFYTGVFQVTQGQWAQVMGNWRAAYFTDPSSKLFRPMEQVSYYEIREDVDNNGPITPNWPESNEVGPNSFMGRLRTRTGLSSFDLPTEAQWEYACRAGTISYYNDGIGGTPNPESNAQMDVLGRYKGNGGYIGGVTAPLPSCGPENGTAIVGSYRPNAWDIYDMLGNGNEWCLDWYAPTLSGGTNPLGPGQTLYIRMMRGGNWNYVASECRSAYREWNQPHVGHHSFGFRLVRTLP